jgi:hypothetical protein
MCSASAVETAAGSQFVAGDGINRKLARRVSWSTEMGTVTYGIEVI